MSIVQYRLELFKRIDACSLGFDDGLFLRPEACKLTIVHPYSLLLIHRSFDEVLIGMPDGLDINSYRSIIDRYGNTGFAMTDAKIKVKGER